VGMEAAAVDYAALLSPRSHPRWEEFSIDARNCIYTITRELQAVQIRPMMLAIARHFSVKEATRAFELCLSWTVRFLIAGGGGGGVLDRHFGLRAAEIYKKEITTAKKLAERMVDIVPTDPVFTAEFAVASVRQAPLARYYLRALDLHLKNEKKPQFVASDDTAAVNLEHILPVNPSHEWDVPPEVAEAYYRRLGNMALVGAAENVKMANRSFKQKREVLKDSAFNLTKTVARFTKWGPTQIEKQQRTMADMAADVWPTS
jgi:hypothetical protein